MSTTKRRQRLLNNLYLQDPQNLTFRQPIQSKTQKLSNIAYSPQEQLQKINIRNFQIENQKLKGQINTLKKSIEQKEEKYLNQIKKYQNILQQQKQQIERLITVIKEFTSSNGKVNRNQNLNTPSKFYDQRTQNVHQAVKYQNNQNLLNPNPNMNSTASFQGKYKNYDKQMLYESVIEHVRPQTLINNYGQKSLTSQMMRQSNFNINNPTTVHLSHQNNQKRYASPPIRIRYQTTNNQTIYSNKNNSNFNNKPLTSVINSHNANFIRQPPQKYFLVHKNNQNSSLPNLNINSGSLNKINSQRRMNSLNRSPFKNNILDSINQNQSILKKSQLIQSKNKGLSIVENKIIKQQGTLKSFFNQILPNFFT